MKFEIKYGLSGGFNTYENNEPEYIEFNTQEEADEYAYEMACQEYDTYDGMHGLRDVQMIMEEEEVDEEEADEIWHEEREGWIEYTAKLVE